MKTAITKKLFAFILFLCGMFSAQFLSAQNCPSNKVYACRFDECGLQECKCVPTSQVQNWTTTIPVCNWKFHMGHGGTWRIGQYEQGAAIVNSLLAYPNPISNSANISFSIEQAQNVSLRILDMNGKLVTILADDSFDAGVYEIAWNATEVNAGIYFLQLTSQEFNETVKLSVTK